ncbi:glutathione S-transferase [Alsobacter metallidurans]|uniref:Glutathione S-transferase n=1 Tax=Alsobacter metallidurans TaxID=340221 RepID=A0A917MG50_9HYPH|nr:glutathione S-transferase family protein [Alsobacter metallidurans]GGH08091.1 glutathione S-transferase [Alsobacter metallidurans]
MATLYHHPLCPHSRFVRLVLGEFGIDVALVEERAFERRTEFLVMNPAGTTPVFVEDPSGAVPGAAVIAEYLDETRGLALGERRLLPSDPMGRVEVRRLVDWFNGKMHDEVTGYLVTEKVFKRFMPAELGGGAPDMAAIRAARSNIRYHLSYIGFLMGSRNWLAGDRLSWADLAAAAQLSAADYLGDVPWNENETAKHWYARVKSRPSFRPLLADRVLGMEPSEHYADLDF